MKRFIITIVCALMCISSFAQTYRFRTTDLAVGTRNSIGNISWGNWNRCNVLIVIDADDEYIKVYSDKEQDYVIVSATDEYRDITGATCVDFQAIDEEGIECKVRIRIQKDNTSQLYAYYSNIAWVYSGLYRM